MPESRANAAYLRERAEQCRRLADAATDSLTTNALRDLAEQFDEEAVEAEARALKTDYQPKIVE